MIEITLLLEEDEILEIINRKLKDKLSVTEEQIISEFIFDQVERSEKFIYGQFNLDKWLNDLLNHLRVIYPGETNYNKYLDLWESEIFEDDKVIVQNKLGDLLLVEEL